MNAFNRSDFLYTQNPDTLVTLDNQEVNHWRHLMGNVNLRHEFSERSTLTVDLDYLYYLDQNPTDYFNQYLSADRELLREEEVQSRKRTPINIAVGAVDLTQQIGDKAKLSTGLKATLSRFTNEVAVNYLLNEWVTDPALSGTFFLQEEIGAAYAALEGSLGPKLTYKAGLRYEYTLSNLSSLTEADIVDRQYSNLFPSLFLSRPLGERQSINLSYSRRITRPTFNNLAPFVIFVDPQTFYSGNAALQPAISDAVKLDYRIRTLLLSVSYTLEDSTIANYQPQYDPETNRQILAAINLRNTHTLNFTATVPFKITDWWEMQYNLTGMWARVSSYLAGEPFSQEQWSFNGFGSQRFTLPWRLGLEISGFYRSPQVWGNGLTEAIWMVNAGLRRSFGENGQAGTLTFNVRDLFNSLEFRSEFDLPAYQLVTRIGIDFSQRTFSLAYTRNLGSSKVRAARQRNTASEEERKRVD